jgi:hypothetical protein
MHPTVEPRPHANFALRIRRAIPTSKIPRRLHTLGAEASLEVQLSERAAPGKEFTLSTTTSSCRPRGRPFVNGNPGRKPGSKNKSTLIAEVLSADDVLVFYNKARQLALDGDVGMLKFLLARSLPRDRLVPFELPLMSFADDGVKALGKIARAVSEGAMTPAEGAALTPIVQAYTAAIDTNDKVKRLDTLEAKLEGGER